MNKNRSLVTSSEHGYGKNGDSHKEGNNKEAQVDPKSFPRKLKKIKEEMELIDPDTLLLKVDPSIDATKTIEQIQRYYNLINSEISRFFHQEQEKAELKKKNNELNKTIEGMIKPHMKNYLSELNDENNNNNNNNSYTNNRYQGKNNKSQSAPKRDNKPVIDYRVKLRSLEKDIVYTYQDFNNTKSKNNRLMQELDEMRKQVMHKTQRLNELKKSLEQQEKQYYSQKKEIEQNLDDKEEIELLEKIKKNQKILEKTNLEMIEKIKETDQFLTQKQAKKKCLDFEANQLEQLSQKIEEKNKKELEDFNHQYKTEIEKVKNFDESSKIIDLLDKEKITNLEEMLKDMFNETKTENIQSFIDYFIKSCEEYKAFKDSIDTITKTVMTLEKEVDELEYIINFCEQNLEVVNDRNLDEDEIKEIEDLKMCSEQFITIQYQAINEAYQDFKTQLTDLIGKYNQEIKEEDNIKKDFLEVYVEYLNNTQEQFKKIAQNSRKKMSKPAKDIFDFNKWDNKWERADKIKENVKKDYEKNGPGNAKIEFKNIKEMVDDIILKNEKK